MNIENILTDKELFLYKQLLYKKELRKEKSLLELNIKNINKELRSYSDVSIAKKMQLTKQWVGFKKCNLYTKCKRLGINLKTNYK